MGSAVCLVRMPTFQNSNARSLTSFLIVQLCHVNVIYKNLLEQQSWAVWASSECIYHIECFNPITFVTYELFKMFFCMMLKAYTLAVSKPVEWGAPARNTTNVGVFYKCGAAAAKHQKGKACSKLAVAKAVGGVYLRFNDGLIYHWKEV